jgi:hypothetical protein
MRARNLSLVSFLVGVIVAAPLSWGAPALLEPSSEHCCREKEVAVTPAAASEALTCDERRVVLWLVQQIIQTESSPDDIEFTGAEIREALAVEVDGLDRERMMRAVRLELVRISCTRSRAGHAKTAS